jgi:thiol-disulfide isomerase/thioredoxin
VRERYALVGTTAVPIVAKYWLNAPSGTTTYVPKGNVTLLEFSAHWCGPCRKSYPAIAALQEQFKARGLKTVFATNLYGFFHEREHLTPEQEIDVDREYFLTEHALPVQIAISPAVNDEAGEVDLNSKNYKVGGIPHIVVIDKLGVIRMIVIGWDPASKERLATMINSVL